MQQSISNAFKYFSVVTIVGPRQSGKTYRSDYFDNLHYVQSVLGDRVVSTCVIYDGDQQSIQPLDAIRRYDSF